MQINVRIDKQLLARIDMATKHHFTTRSQLVRSAIYWFLMPHHRKLEQSEEDYIFETIQYRRRLASINKWHNEHGGEIDPYDI